MQPIPPSSDLNVQRLWEKYEDIAVHFNELLIQLRMRSLAGIAAVSTVVGVFANGSNGENAFEWIVAVGAFSAMALIWVAICCLDLLYYNRLLSGAVATLAELEQKTQRGEPINSITLSTDIIKEFNEKRPLDIQIGVKAFYGIVLFLIIISGLFSLVMFCIRSG